MKKLLLFVLTALALGACAQNTPTPLPTVVLDAPSGSDTGAGARVSAEAEVVPVEHVSLSFPLTGRLESLAVEVGDTVAVGDDLAALDTLILEARVAEAEAGVAAAETEVRYLRRVGPADEQLSAKIALVDRANALLEQARAVLDQATLTAPIGGTVVAIEAAPGETVLPGQVVIVIGDLTRMQIETTDLSERDVPAVIGQPATVFIEALGEEFEGEVIDIARSSETIGGDVVFKVTIELRQQPEGLRWGMSAEAEIQTEQ
jgi:multidrug efflux pump subunit AcrA (membrane-fusion protein)